jgi:hypothetical protein
MKVIIAGSRSIDMTVAELTKIVENSGFNIHTIISGNAKGIDRVGEQYAHTKNIKLEIHKPDWSMGRAAGIIRNKTMGEYADALIAIYDGESKGTKHMIDFMKKKGKPVYVHII